MAQNELQESLAGIRQKIKQLLEKQAALEKENYRLSIERDNLRKQLEQKNTEIEELKEQTDVLKSGIQNWHPEQKKLFVKRIDAYLREIDKCLALINE